MRYCEVLDMWRNDMTEKDFFSAGCGGNCDKCMFSATAGVDPGSGSDVTAAGSGYRDFIAGRFEKVV